MKEIEPSGDNSSKLVYRTQSEGFDDRLAIPGYVHLSDTHTTMAKVAFSEL